MGIVEYDTRIIPRLAEIAAPLTDLCGNEPWRWSTTCQVMFESVKEAITERGNA
jgi:hypothetical protein